MVRINAADIPESESRSIGVAFAEAVRAFYSDPKNVKAFHEWKERRETNGHQREN